MRALDKGSIPVMLQPFNLDGSVDLNGLNELIEFYLSSGSVALFAACASTEITHLSSDEICNVVLKTVQKVNGRVPVIAGAICPGVSVEQQAQFIRMIADSGADVVGITASMVAEQGDEDDIFRERISRILELTGSIQLGIYECPLPYHRLVPPETLAWLAQTGRFLFHKDTCCNIDLIREKVAAVHGTPLQFYNAHTPTLLESLHAGGSGYSGVGTNFYPEVYAEICAVFKIDPVRTDEIERFLKAEELLLANEGYPQTAKMFLQHRGLNITSRIRIDKSIQYSDASKLIESVKLHKKFIKDTNDISGKERLLCS